MKRTIITLVFVAIAISFLGTSCTAQNQGCKSTQGMIGYGNYVR